MNHSNPASQPASSERQLGELIEEFHPGKIVTWSLVMLAFFFVLVWLVLAVSGIVMLFRGQVDILGTLMTLIPWTLLTAGIVYAAIFVGRYRLAVYQNGMLFRKFNRVTTWMFEEVLDLKVETIENQSRDGQGHVQTVLFIMSKHPQVAPVRIKTVLNNRPIFSTAVNAWRAAHNVA